MKSILFLLSLLSSTALPAPLGEEQTLNIPFPMDMDHHFYNFIADLEELQYEIKKNFSPSSSDLPLGSPPLSDSSTNQKDMSESASSDDHLRQPVDVPNFIHRQEGYSTVTKPLPTLIYNTVTKPLPTLKPSQTAEPEMDEEATALLNLIKKANTNEYAARAEIYSDFFKILEARKRPLTVSEEEKILAAESPIVRKQLALALSAYRSTDSKAKRDAIVRAVKVRDEAAFRMLYKRFSEHFPPDNVNGLTEMDIDWIDDVVDMMNQEEEEQKRREEENKKQREEAKRQRQEEKKKQEKKQEIKNKRQKVDLTEGVGSNFIS